MTHGDGGAAGTREPAVLLRSYRATGSPIAWHVDDSLRSDPGLVARDRSAQMITTLPLEQAAPLNGSLAPADMEALVGAAECFLLRDGFRGVGIDLGAGLGVLAATVAKRAEVECVLAVEVCPTFVDGVIPQVAREVLDECSDRVVPVLGSFDSLELDDETVDFAVEIDSLHHASDLGAVVTECARVLRRGGQVICFDRAHHDELPNEVRDVMLDREYDADWIERNGYPPGVRMTRRENGEHEIRLGEWFAAFSNAGLVVERVVFFEPDVSLRMAAKGVLARLPRPLRRRFMAIPPPPGYPRAWVAARIGRAPAASGRIVFAPKHVTGFAVRKP
jgi:SAM-dependent methyltransferase